jgi:spermidine synthase
MGVEPDMTGEANLATRIVTERATSSYRYRFFVATCAAFMVLSGFASLVYQVTWVRLLGLGLGSTSASISIVVSSFFLGMSLGSFFFERVARTGFAGIKAYAVLELCIGACGLLLLPVLLNLDSVLSFAPALGTQPVLKLLVTLLLLVVPTTCMGATFPVMAALLASNDARLGRLISHLYSLNTFGAVLGAVVSGFVLIPNWGLDGSIYVAAGANILIGIAAILLSRMRTSPGRETIVLTHEIGMDPADRQPVGWLGAAALTLAMTGFASVATQVGWTKYLSIFVGSTIYGLSVILSVFLAGIALGAWLIRSRIDTVRSPQTLMAIGLLLAGIALLATRAGLGYVPALQHVLNSADVAPGTITTLRYLALVLLMMPPTLVFGALFPLNLKLFCGGPTGVRTRIGKAYAVNTLASIAGAAFAGFVAIPWLGTDALLLGMAALVAATSSVWMGQAVAVSHRMAVASVGALAVSLLILFPGIDYRQLIATVGYDDYSKSGESPEYLFLREGKAGVIGLITYDGDTVKLQNNGLNEAQLTQSNSDDVPLIEAFLGFIPYALHRSPTTAFVVGFGGGTTTRILADTDLGEIQVVELEPAIVEAGQYVKNGPISALSDPRVTISYNDARNTLVVEDKRYDLIVSQPSHPWLAGSAGLFSQEFWEITKSRLNKGGIFAQWVNLFRMDAPTLKSLFKAFFAVYPHGMVFADSGNIVMIGSVDELVIDYKRFNTLLSKPVFEAKFRANSIRETNDILWYFALSRNEAVEASEAAVPSRDTNVLSEIRLSKITESPTGDDSPASFTERFSSMDVGSYLGPDVESKLTLLSMYFLREEAYERASLAISQLAKFDARTARVLSHRRALEMLDFASATEVYQAYPSWPEEIHLAQARAMIEIGAYDDARAALSQAGQGEDARVERERLDHLEGVSPNLLEQASATSSAWLLMARADFGDKAAEDLLVSRAAKQSEFPAGSTLHLYTILVRHFASMRNDRELQAASVALAKEISKLGERLATIAEKALDAENPRIAALAIRRMESLDDKPVGLDNIRHRLSDM